jgi:cell division protein FtsB
MRYKGKKWTTVAVLAVPAIISAYLLVIFIQQQSFLDDNKEKLDAIKKKVDEQQILQQKLLDENQNALTDESIERIAREILGMVKPGEKVYIETDD